MKKVLVRTLLVVACLILVLIIIGGIGYYYVSSNVLTFEDEISKKEMNYNKLQIDGFSFIDRNNNNKLDLYEDNRESVESRANDLLSKLTLEEKIHLLKGSGIKSALGISSDGIPGAVGTIVPTPRLGLPEIYLSDGPAGLRIASKRKNQDRTYYCTAFPIGTLLASTWDKELVESVGNSMGNEALNYGIDVILGPGVNIHRHPLCGRNFEYYSEDPFLSGNIGAAMVNGIESNGVGTSPKHFVVNNQETSRNWNDAIVSERALREIYLKGYEIIVKKSQPWTIMTSYNKINGTYAPENKRLLTDILKQEWGFEGVVMTDWYGGQSATAIINAGNDLIEPGTKNDWDELKDSAADGSLPLSNINTSVKRILKLILKSKKMENYEFKNNPDLEKHALITRKSAAEGMVLLKNSDNTLPMKNISNIALIGSSSYEFIAGGTGSGDVEEAYSIALDDALTKNGFEINDVALNEYFIQNAKNLKDKEGDTEIPGAIGVAMSMMNPYTPIKMDYSTELLNQISAASDIAIVTIGRNSGESSDRVLDDDFLLSKKEEQMIKKTCDVFHSKGKKVVVILNIGGVIETSSWKNQPDAILLAWQGGQEGGNSVVDILTGKINPSGKLPMTFPVDINDHKSTLNFPMDGEKLELSDMIFGVDYDKPENEKIRNKDYTVYEEGIYVGYRHFDKNNIKVSFPFGYGLSYTNFEYSDLKVIKQDQKINLSLKIKNTGYVKGKEIIQVYISKINSKIDRPTKELKGFSKTRLLNVAESSILEIEIPLSDFSYWNEEINNWSIENGEYNILIGSSSRDIKLEEKIKI
ncbi:MAG: glycosyl hydrolase [Flavobacteriaceae bacterium]|nr:glycosyl hydrolase [Flavobacteriaceae bacterium]